MQSRTVTSTLLASLCVWPGLLWGQATGTPSRTEKIAVINIQAAIANTQEGKKASADIQKKYQPRRDDLQRQQQEIAALQDQVQKQATTLSDDEKLRLQKELADKQKVFKRAQEDANSDFQEDSQEAIRRIGEKMVKIINQYSQQNRLSLVIDDSQIPVYYLAPGTDITLAVVKLYDADNPVPGAASASNTGPSAATRGPSAKPAGSAKP